MPTLELALAPAVDLLIAVVGLEALALWLWHRATGGGLVPAAFVPNLAAGALLMLALRLALSPGLEAAALACLAGAGVAHLLDLRRRIVAQSRPPSATQDRAR